MTRSLRRVPEQLRSVALVNEVLEACRELLVEQGAGQVTMAAITKRSGVKASAIYRYFPNVHAVLRELALRTFASDDPFVSTAELAHESAQELVRFRVREFWTLFQRETFRLPLAAAMLCDLELLELDQADTRARAAEIATELVSHSRHDIETLERRLVLVLECVKAAMRLAANPGDDDPDLIVETFADIAAEAVV